MLYIIDITVNQDVTAEQHETLFPKHAAWFKKHFDAGRFLIVGPSPDRERAGVVIAEAGSREALQAILAEDSYYPNLAQYLITELDPKMVAADWTKFQTA